MQENYCVLSISLCTWMSASTFITSVLDYSQSQIRGRGSKFRVFVLVDECIKIAWVMSLASC